MGSCKKFCKTDNYCYICSPFVGFYAYGRTQIIIKQLITNKNA